MQLEQPYQLAVFVILFSRVPNHFHPLVHYNLQLFLHLFLVFELAIIGDTKLVLDPFIWGITIILINCLDVLLLFLLQNYPFLYVNDH